MATPPRNNQRDPHNASSQSKATSWVLYLAIALVILLVILWLFGDVFTDDTVLEDEPTVQTTEPETSPAATDPVTPPPPTTPEAETETVTPADPAADAAEEEEADEVIEIEGDADVEILDDS